MGIKMTPLYSELDIQFREILVKKSSPDRAFNAFVKFLTKTFKLDSVLYGIVPLPTKGDTSQFTREWMVLHNRPDEVMYRYMVGGAIEDDPDIAYCRKHKRAVRWYDQVLWENATPAQIKARDDFFAAGLENGITIPIDMTSETMAGVGLGTTLMNRGEFEKMLTEHFPAIESLARVFHAAIIENGWSAKIYGLTKIELKTLSYLASGYTFQQISELDNVSTSAIELRMRTARRRLGALTTIAAVSKATSLNLVSAVEFLPEVTIDPALSPEPDATSGPYRASESPALSE